jgi:hypothetical protein
MLPNNLQSGVSKAQQRKIDYNTYIINLYRNYFNNCKKERTETYLTKTEDYKSSCLKFKADMEKVILAPDVDTIGLNKNDPTKWNIPDGSYRQLLIDLNIDQSLPIIKETIQKRKNAKSMLYRLKKTTGTLGGRKRRRRGTRKSKGRKSRKSKR